MNDTFTFAMIVLGSFFTFMGTIASMVFLFLRWKKDQEERREKITVESVKRHANHDREIASVAQRIDRLQGEFLSIKEQQITLTGDMKNVVLKTSDATQSLAAATHRVLDYVGK